MLKFSSKLPSLLGVLGWALDTCIWKSNGTFPHKMETMKICISVDPLVFSPYCKPAICTLSFRNPCRNDLLAPYRNGHSPHCTSFMVSELWEQGWFLAICTTISMHQAICTQLTLLMQRFFSGAP